MPTTVPGNEEDEMGGSWGFLVSLSAADVTFTLLSKGKEIQNCLDVMET